MEYAAAIQLQYPITSKNLPVIQIITATPNCFRTFNIGQTSRRKALDIVIRLVLVETHLADSHFAGSLSASLQGKSVKALIVPRYLLCSLRHDWIETGITTSLA